MELEDDRRTVTIPNWKPDVVLAILLSDVPKDTISFT
jgi:hypothetical protein